MLVDDAEVADGGSNAPNPGGDFHQRFILLHDAVVSTLEAQQVQTGHCKKSVFLFNLPEIDLFVAREPILRKEESERAINRGMKRISVLGNDQEEGTFVFYP